MIFRLLNWQGIAGIGVALVLLAMLTVQKLDAAHWKKEAGASSASTSRNKRPSP